MGKIRVYELAQQMGLDNKELIARLQAVGVEVKNHMSALEDADVQKLKAAATPTAETQAEPATVKVVSQEEVRVKSTLIRRRAKVVETVAEEAPESVPEEEAPPVIEGEEKPEKIEKKAVEAKAPAVPDKAKEAAEAHTPGRARILGRVELPGMKPAERPAERREATRPAPPRAPERPVRPGEKAPAVVPPPAGPEAERHKGKKFVPAPVEEAKGKPKKGGPVERRKEVQKKAELQERRERVFEPGPRGPKKKRERERVQIGKKTEITVPKAIKRIIRISETITVGELAKRMGVKANDLIRALMKMGMMATINHPLDFDTAVLLAGEFGYEIENVAVDLDEIMEAAPDLPETLEKRPPVVTIMGHVDHGKTSLLDAIREANVIAGEAGGITQHIGAYDVELNGQKITFLDTPGHEAFTAMRARGAKVTDIVILVVAADDGVMPQTKEAINHSKAAGVPIIVAINKIDKPEAKPERVKQELTEHGLVSEEWGGDTTMVEVSAKKRINLEGLLEMVLLQADVMDLKANPNKSARGTIVEAKLDKGRGPVATVLVQEGTLKLGDYCVVGVHSGRVRAMQNDRGGKVLEAGPSTPVELIGLSGVPDSGDIFVAMTDEKQAKEIATLRQIKMREAELAKHSKLSLEQLYEKIQKGEVKDLNVIVKGDVHGSVEAVGEALRKLSTDAVRLNVIHSAVGAITETDVNLAAASNAIIIGFSVRPEVKAHAHAEKEGVDIRLYNIIYDAVEDVKKAMEGLLEPTLKEKYLGRAEVRDIFSVPKIGTVAGCYIQDGKILRNSQVRLLRDNIVIYQGKLASLRRFKDDVKEVSTGYECGMGLENYSDIKVGDIIEAFEIEKVATKL
ncbi:MAG: translation initiation factor IF-2 [Geobacter sp.]|nr:translation initiation factor IF-2 [Geobacter sp.]